MIKISMGNYCRQIADTAEKCGNSLDFSNVSKSGSVLDIRELLQLNLLNW